MTIRSTKNLKGRGDVTADEGALQERASQASAIVQRNMLWAFGLGALPFPLIDLVGITGAQLKMLSELSELYGVKFSESAATKIITSLLAGFGSVSLGTTIVGSAVKLIPGLGGLLGLAAVPMTASALTYATGKVFIMHFESGGTVLDFDPDAMRAHFRDEFEQGMLAAKALQKEKEAGPQGAAAT